MTRLQALLPSGARLLALDALFIAWAVAWVAIGLSVASEVKGLTALSDTVSEVGAAVEQSGRAIRELEALPLVGDRVAEPAERIEEAGAGAVESGRESRNSVENLSTLLGLAIALIPSLPLIGLYLPLRLSRQREVRAVRRTLAEAGDDQEFRAFLARRAVDSLPYRRLRAISARPWRDIAEGRHEGLARAELERLGLSEEELRV